MVAQAQNIASSVVIESAIESVLLWVAAFAFLRLFRRSSAAIRQIVFALPLFLPVALVTVFHVLDVMMPLPLDRAGVLEEMILSALALPLPFALAFSLAGLVGIAASLAFLVRQLVAWRRARLAWKRQQGDESPLLYRCSLTLGVLASRLGRPVPKLILDDRWDPGSLALGWCNYVFVPRALVAQLDDEELEALLAHEMGHIIRKDGLLDCMAKVCRNLMLFNPVAHLSLSRFELEREQATDDLTAKLGRNRLALASCLLKGYRFRGRRVWLPITSLVGGRSALESRVQRLMRAATPRPPARVEWLTVGVFFAAVSAAFVAVL